ncbi:MAG: hypothetical protein AUK24_09170 [Syntrophaceae bacterium CG2_30_49_12]|nr:MAG: hypothetical protein AUK24_09170 [Syntrophaceae bacterium CG2_30_49_12]PIP05814.1 MAG: hypothetical protein COX52_09940 [Syntrophobacterales bacterium CG23_combo_of_CG06-09_8_20_14_all_48_27]PJA49504.1 MAG: hypothetical protein CO171_05095 [Syntrophobacterales bacterium CG_4_9_14_3_um_filter_49_8]PJC72869.1 MAG: hypothetical protein CO012_10980 [Syntrophobacterales bacterium CG_4_8_14_3_um_filter_49_14]
MENVLYSVNLAIHVLAAIFCVAAPFYQLRWVTLRGKLGHPIIYPFDRVLENVLSLQPRLCFTFIVTLIITGFAFPLIHYAFHGEWREASNLSLAIFSAKTILAFIGLAVNIHGVWILDPQIQKTFATFSPAEQPPDELLNRFWDLRATRKRLCQFCFGLALTIVIITPILRFYK